MCTWDKGIKEFDDVEEYFKNPHENDANVVHTNFFLLKKRGLYRAK